MHVALHSKEEQQTACGIRQAGHRAQDTVQDVTAFIYCRPSPCLSRREREEKGRCAMGVVVALGSPSEACGGTTTTTATAAAAGEKGHGWVEGVRASAAAAAAAAAGRFKAATSPLPFPLPFPSP